MSLELRAPAAGALALTLHALLLAAPVWLIRPQALSSAPVLAVLLGALALQLGELILTRETVEPSRAGPLGEDEGLAQWTALVFLMIQLSALTERALLGPAGVPRPLLLLGVLALVLGVTLRLAAIATLGPAFRSTHEQAGRHGLIRTGLYRWLRHPSELGLILIILGELALLESRVGLACLILLHGPLTWRRLAREDAALACGAEKLRRETSRRGC